MKNVIRFIFACLIFSSCKKDSPDSDNLPPSPLPIPDTLTTGWTKAGNGIPSSNIYDIFFTTPMLGCVTTNQGIFKSTDGGITWASLNFINTPYNIGGSGNRYCFVGTDNRIHYTTNGTDFFSNTYTLANPNIQSLVFSDCFFANPTLVYACSGRYIYKSFNGGASFDSVYSFPVGTLSFALSFTSSTDGWAMRSTGLFKTTDGGLNWSLSSVFDGSATTGSVEFLNTNIGVASDGKKVFKTVDSGINWIEIFSLPTAEYIDVDIITASEIYISTRKKIYKSLNGGSSFTQVLSSSQNGIFEIHFIDSNTGWACGSNGVVYRFKQ